MGARIRLSLKVMGSPYLSSIRSIFCNISHFLKCHRGIGSCTATGIQRGYPLSQSLRQTSNMKSRHSFTARVPVFYAKTHSPAQVLHLQTWKNRHSFTSYILTFGKRKTLLSLRQQLVYLNYIKIPNTHSPNVNRCLWYSSYCTGKMYLFMAGNRALVLLNWYFIDILLLFVHHLDPFWSLTDLLCEPISASPPWHFSLWEKWPNHQPHTLWWSFTTSHFDTVKKLRIKLSDSAK